MQKKRWLLKLKLLLLNKATMITREDCIKIGEVSKTHGLQGAVVVTTDSDWLERYEDKPVFLLLEGAPVPFFIAEDGLTERNHTSYIVQFDSISSQEQAERLLGAEVLLEQSLLEEEEWEDEEGDFFDLIHFDVTDLVSGTTGRVLDVVDYSGNVVLTLDILGKEILLPLSETYISAVDWENASLQVNIPKELAELN